MQPMLATIRNKAMAQYYKNAEGAEKTLTIPWIRYGCNT